MFQGQKNPGCQLVTIVKPVSVVGPSSPRVFTSLPSNFSLRKATELGRVVEPGHRSTALAFRGHWQEFLLCVFEMIGRQRRRGKSP